MRRVIVESPIQGQGRTGLGRWINQRVKIAYARAAVLDCVLNRGEAPICSHLLFTQRGILRDADPDERKIGIEAGHAYLPVVDAAVFYIDLGISEGMKQGEREAAAAGVITERRSLAGWGQPPSRRRAY